MDAFLKSMSNAGFGLDINTGSIKKKPTTDSENDNSGDYEDYTSLDKEEKREKIKKLKIANNKELRKLVERDLVTSILGEIGQSVQNNIVDQAKRKANVWAALLGIPEKEREIEKLLSDLGEEEISGLIGNIERLSSDGVFE